MAAAAMPTAAQIAEELARIESAKAGLAVPAPSDSELKLQTVAVVSQLRQFANSIDAEDGIDLEERMTDHPSGPLSDDEMREISRKRVQKMLNRSYKRKADFVLIRVQALKLRNDLRKRLPHAEAEKGSTQSLLEEGFIVTASSVNEAADYLALLGAQIK